MEKGTEAKKSSSTSWITKVLAKLNLSDEGKVGLFGDKLKSVWTKTVRDHKRKIQQLEIEMEDRVQDAQEKLTDAQDAYADAFIAIDTYSIETSADRAEYVDRFTSRLLNAKNDVLKKEKQIEDIKNSYQKQIDEFKEKITILNEFISNL